MKDDGQKGRESMENHKVPQPSDQVLRAIAAMVIAITLIDVIAYKGGFICLARVYASDHLGLSSFSKCKPREWRTCTKSFADQKAADHRRVNNLQNAKRPWLPTDPQAFIILLSDRK